MLKAVIFDMDGVIIDSEPIYFRVMQQLALELGFVMPRNEYDTYVGIASREMWGKIITLHQLNLGVDALQKKEAVAYLSYLEAQENLVPIKGVQSLLDDLAEHGVRIALASSSSRHNIDTVLRILKLQHYFSNITSGENVCSSKPAPDIFLLTAQSLGVSPAECLVIEDSTNGVIAARSAGMCCVGYQNPSSGQQDLSRATTVVTSLEELNYHILLKINAKG